MKTCEADIEESVDKIRDNLRADLALAMRSLTHTGAIDSAAINAAVDEIIGKMTGKLIDMAHAVHREDEDGYETPDDDGMDDALRALRLAIAFARYAEGDEEGADRMFRAAEDIGWFERVADARLEGATR